MSKVDLVVFDMIGTTVAASPRIPEAFIRAFADVSINLGPNDVVAIRGKSKREAIAELLAQHGADSGLAETVYGAFKSHLVSVYRHGEVNAVPGSDATFHWCREHEIQVALTTGFDRAIADLILEKLGWIDIVDTVVCNDDVSRGRPAPDLILMAMSRLDHIDVSRVASVGDTISDLEAGANAGTGLNIGVLSGAHSREQLLSAPHTALIDSVAVLQDLLA
jgi:phosphonatase-like hydrolase